MSVRQKYISNGRSKFLYRRNQEGKHFIATYNTFAQTMSTRFGGTRAHPVHLYNVGYRFTVRSCTYANVNGRRVCVLSNDGREEVHTRYERNDAHEGFDRKMLCVLGNEFAASLSGSGKRYTFKSIESCDRAYDLQGFLRSVGDEGQFMTRPMFALRRFKLCIYGAEDFVIGDDICVVSALSAHFKVNANIILGIL